jgi:hypothetical protein
LSSDRLKATYDLDSLYGTRSGYSAHGYGFWVEDAYKDAFDRVLTYIGNQSRVALENTYPDAGQRCLELMARDVHQFVGKISYSGEEPHEFAGLPVLKTIAPGVFVDAWLNTPKANEAWYWIKIALEGRYQHHALASSSNPNVGWLASEREWIKSVLAELRERADAAAGFAKFRIERAIPRINFPEE